MTRQEDDRLIRRKIGQRAEGWRALALDIPAWFLDDEGAEPAVREVGSGDLLATLHGPWKSNVGRYLTAMDSEAGRAVAELLRCIGGGRSQDIRDAALVLLRSLGLEEQA